MIDRGILGPGMDPPEELLSTAPASTSPTFSRSRILSRMLFRDDADDNIGIRFPIGIEYYFDDLPIAVFVEIVPILDLVPSSDFDINGGLGGRFYF